jgi:signal recognition particle subunit SRP54
MFDQLESRLSGALKKIRGLSKLTDSNMSEALKEVRHALLEADVALPVVKEFIEKVKAESKGEAVHKSLAPGQQVVKIVHQQLVALLGGEKAGIRRAEKGPTVILMAGLQGSGKTTTTAKLALHLSKEGLKPMMVSTDVYRPAAREQLAVLGEQLGIPVFKGEGLDDPVKIAKAFLKEAKKESANALIIDTAGRLEIDDEMMTELEKIKKAVNPTEVLFVADAMTGQQAANVAKTFHERTELTGVILTKLDGDARGGAALSVKSVTGCPIKFSGIGEKPEQFEVFHPDRMAQRILGMGDVLSLIEKVEEASSREESERLAKKMGSGAFDLNDFIDQIKMIRNMGPLDQVMGMIPGLKMPAGADVDDSQLNQIEAIINSMTKEERQTYTIINGSRKLRIAEGCGMEVPDVNRLLKQFVKMKKMMKNFKKPGFMEQMMSMGKPGIGN